MLECAGNCVGRRQEIGRTYEETRGVFLVGVCSRNWTASTKTRRPATVDISGKRSRSSGTDRRWQFKARAEQHGPARSRKLLSLGTRGLEPGGFTVRKCLVPLFLLLSLCLSARSVRAQQAGSATQSPAVSAAAEDAQNSRLANLEKQVADARSAGDNSWMLTSSALVLLMTGPGLALFYSGLVRKKNVLATMMQSFAMMVLVTIRWRIFGYSLAFGSGNSFIGGFEHLFLRGVGGDPSTDYAATIPHQTFMIYQLMFAIITPALITGAFAERMKFKAMLLFMVLWSVVVYSPMAHMVWGKGGLLNAALGGRIPTLDFAGGTVVHVTSGVSALVCALYLGKRLGFPKEH